MCLWFCVEHCHSDIAYCITLHDLGRNMKTCSFLNKIKSAMKNYRNSRKEVQHHLSEIKVKSSVMLLLLLPILKFSWVAWISNTEMCMYSFDTIHTSASWVLYHSYKNTILSIFKNTLLCKWSDFLKQLIDMTLHLPFFNKNSIFIEDVYIILLILRDPPLSINVS